MWIRELATKTNTADKRIGSHSAESPVIWTSWRVERREARGDTPRHRHRSADASPPFEETEAVRLQCVEVRLDLFPHRLVGEAAPRGAKVVHDELDLLRSGNHAGHGGGSDDLL